MKNLLLLIILIYYVHTFDLLSKIDSVIGNNHNKKPNPNSGQLTDSIKALLSSSTNISNRAVRKNSYRNQVSVDTKVLSPTKKPSLHEKVSDNRIIKDEEEREWNYDQNSNEFIVPDEIKGEDDYTKILRIQSILETMKLIKTKRNSKAFILTPPILKGLTEKEKVIKSKLDAGNINDTQSKENQAQFNKVIRSPPNFLM